MNLKENTTISDLLDIFPTDQVIIFSAAAILFIIFVAIFIVLRAKKNDRIRIKKLKVGPIEAEIEEETRKEDTVVPVYRIAILRQPASISGNPATLNQLIVRVYDRNESPLKNKRVTITLEGKEDQLEQYISGSLSEISDDKGEVFFSGLSLLRRGTYSIVFHADGASAKARPFSVTPPGLDIDFVGKKFGSDEYIGTLRLAISLNKAGDKVSLNGDEIN